MFTETSWCNTSNPLSCTETSCCNMSNPMTAQRPAEAPDLIPVRISRPPSSHKTTTTTKTTTKTTPRPRCEDKSRLKQQTVNRSHLYQAYIHAQRKANCFELNGWADVGREIAAVMVWLVEVLLYVHRNRRLIRDGSPGRPPRLSHSS